VTEERSCVLSRDGSQGLGNGWFELFQNAGLDAPQPLFQLGPSLFDGVEVGRVGRPIERLRAAAFDELTHALDFVGVKLSRITTCPGSTAAPAPAPGRRERRGHRWATQWSCWPARRHVVSAASTVSVHQWPTGTASESRSGRGGQPQRRVISVVTPLSSRNTKQAGSSSVTCSQHA
jgi:hypothetical protein